MKNNTTPSTAIHNVIILDKSGSMESIRRQAIDGVNETLSGIRRMAKENPGVKQKVTIALFCGCGIKTLVDDLDIEKVHPISARQYVPCCMTPLYDAIGITCSKMMEATYGEASPKVAVTIITDGYENASKEWGGAQVKSLIEKLKAAGWMFAYIGADHDVEKVAVSISIENTMKFQKTDEDTQRMFVAEQRARHRWAKAMCDADRVSNAEDRKRMRTKANTSYYDEK